ncbi:MAG: EthD family reductase, partial [Chloroflexota bacterium]|nr:EthD family reductase [Chloroflexota bacterium]
MIQLTVLYGQPQDPAAFDRHYQETHVHVARKMPGVKGYT